MVSLAVVVTQHWKQRANKTITTTMTMTTTRMLTTTETSKNKNKSNDNAMSKNGGDKNWRTIVVIKMKIADFV
jgi:hypothetical protein